MFCSLYEIITSIIFTILYIGKPCPFIKNFENVRNAFILFDIYQTDLNLLDVWNVSFVE